mmetsp:Transcript_32006/g.80590  ORF Transcript_32006/g.80590 Transcript_32006/m.80590 type:complete len:224 (-) Transcript_32006:541-1212(-)
MAIPGQLPTVRLHTKDEIPKLSNEAAMRHNFGSTIAGGSEFGLQHHCFAKSSSLQPAAALIAALAAAAVSSHDSGQLSLSTWTVPRSSPLTNASQTPLLTMSANKKNMEFRPPIATTPCEPFSHDGAVGRRSKRRLMRSQASLLETGFGLCLAAKLRPCISTSIAVTTASPKAPRCIRSCSPPAGGEATSWKLPPPQSHITSSLSGILLMAPAVRKPNKASTL